MQLEFKKTILYCSTGLKARKSSKTPVNKKRNGINGENLKNPIRLIKRGIFFQ